MPEKLSSEREHINELVRGITTPIDTKISNGNKRALGKLLEETQIKHSQSHAINLAKELQISNIPRFQQEKVTDAKLGHLYNALIARSKAGHYPKNIAGILMPELPHLSERHLGELSKAIIATSDSGEPYRLAEVAIEALKYGGVKSKETRPFFDFLKRAYATKVTITRRTELSERLKQGFVSGDISTNKILKYYAPPPDIKIPKQFHYGDIVFHAIHVTGVPKKQIPNYQREILEHGHFPSAKMIEEMHKRNTENVLKKKREQVRKQKLQKRTPKKRL